VRIPPTLGNEGTLLKCPINLDDGWNKKLGRVALLAERILRGREKSAVNYAVILLHRTEKKRRKNFGKGAMFLSVTRYIAFLVVRREEKNSNDRPKDSSGPVTGTDKGKGEVFA